MSTPDGRMERYKKAIDAHDDKDVVDNLENLGLQPEQLQSVRLLDLGAGGGEFARFARRQGAEVIPVGLYLSEKERQRLAASHMPYVIADATQLPFEDETFDLIVSHAAIPNVIRVGSYGPKEEDFVTPRVNALREAVRVLRPGGEIRLAPVIRNWRDEQSTPPDRNAARYDQVFEEVRKSPALEVVEEILEKDVSSASGLTYDLWRVIIRKKVPVEERG